MSRTDGVDLRLEFLSIARGMDHVVDLVVGKDRQCRSAAESRTGASLFSIIFRDLTALLQSEASNDLRLPRLLAGVNYFFLKRFGTPAHYPRRELTEGEIFGEKAKSYAHGCYARRRYVCRRDVGAGADHRISNARQRPQTRRADRHRRPCHWRRPAD